MNTENYIELLNIQIDAYTKLVENLKKEKNRIKKEIASKNKWDCINANLKKKYTEEEISKMDAITKLVLGEIFFENV